MTYPQFPDLQPSKRNVVMGDVPNTKMRAMNGKVFSVVYGDKASADRLQLTYRLLRNDALLFISHYGSCDGTYGAFKVRQSIGTQGSKYTFAGMDFRNGTKDLLSQEGGFGTYRYARPPSMTQVSKTVYELRVELVKALT